MKTQVLIRIRFSMEAGSGWAMLIQQNTPQGRVSARAMGQRQRLSP